MRIMGTQNIKAVYRRSREGRLNNMRGDNASFDPMAMSVLQYMAAVAMDYEPDRTYHEGDIPPRCYWAGWPAMVEDFGMVMPSEQQAHDPNVDPEALFQSREQTSRNRISRAARWLEERGLINKLLPANTRYGRAAYWLLMIGDDFANARVEQSARTALGLGVFGGH